MKAKEKMVAVTKTVKSATASIRRDMGGITLSDRMEMIADAQIKYELTSAIKELEATLKDLKKF
jgi:hypothetical protein